MLGKLLKHEFYATGRLLLPIYGIITLTTILAAVMRQFFGKNIIMNMAVALSLTAYALSLLLIGAATFLIVIQRFYKNLLGDEGYLMFTLPASIHHLVLSKLAVSMTWIITTIVSICASIIVVIGAKARDTFFQLFVSELGNNRTAIFITLALFMVMSMVSNVLLIYMSISFGQQFSRARLLGSFIAYIVVYGAIQIILVTVILGIGLFGAANNSISEWTAYLDSHPMVLIWAMAFPVTVVLTGISYYATTNLLKRRLNLE